MIQLGASQLAAILVVVWVGVFAGLALFDVYRAERSSARPRRRRRLDALGFTPQALGGFSFSRLALVSILGLFLELLMIRWISSEIRIFAYFKNFVLIACFLGFGLGCYLCRRPVNVAPLVGPAVLFALLIKLPWKGLRELVAALPSYLGALSEVHMWGVPALPLNASTLSGLGAALAVVVPLFGLLALMFIPVGQLVGWYLENAGNGILGYSVNILGSLAGILLYTLLCFLDQPPATWFAAAGAMLVLLLWPRAGARWLAAAAFTVCVGLVSLSPGREALVRWSPYQKLTLTPQRDGDATIAYHLNTNDSWYQQVIDLSEAFVRSRPQLFRGVPIEWNAYNVPYRFYPHPPSVLVLGAGMGNDVAAALRNGAGRVVAVEIDPAILELGGKLHFEKPYQSPRVQLVVDDARSYIQNSREQFDLVKFSLLDSHTTSSHFSNIRIDNYVYTVEALEAARRLLRPDGVFIVKFQVDTPWIAGRLHDLLASVFGRPPLQMQAEESYTTAGRFFITGSTERIAHALSDPKVAAYVQSRGDFQTAPATPTTDDWPYFYQQEPGLPASVIVISAVLALLCAWLVRATGLGGGSLRWHFFFLGAGFLLLEAQIISKMALLFGTTWVVNSIVISALLVLIVGSNLLAGWKPDLPLSAAYIGIVVSILISWAVPLEKFFFDNVWLKAAAAAGVLCLPVFFAGIVFVRSYAAAGFSGEALGSNLFGALVGGLLESLSLWTGLRSLIVLAALLYLASYVALGHKKPIAARTPPLVPGPSAS